LTSSLLDTPAIQVDLDSISSGVGENDASDDERLGDESESEFVGCWIDGGILGMGLRIEIARLAGGQNGAEGESRRNLQCGGL
jgi:hypothetical protein